MNKETMNGKTNEPKTAWGKNETRDRKNTAVDSIQKERNTEVENAEDEDTLSTRSREFDKKNSDEVNPDRYSEGREKLPPREGRQTEQNIPKI